jgi:hypothetical protein
MLQPPEVVRKSRPPRRAEHAERVFRCRGYNLDSILCCLKTSKWFYLRTGSSLEHLEEAWNIYAVTGCLPQLLNLRLRQKRCVQCNGSSTLGRIHEWVAARYNSACREGPRQALVRCLQAPSKIRVAHRLSAHSSDFARMAAEVHNPAELPASCHCDVLE